LLRVRYTNLEKKNLADSVDIYGRVREIFTPPAITLILSPELVTDPLAHTDDKEGAKECTS
jgi:hypothetical protein